MGVEMKNDVAVLPGSSPEDDDKWWDSDKFEYSVSAALCAVFEDSIRVIDPPKSGKWELATNLVVPTSQDLRDLRRIGPYFPPGDRLIMKSVYWHDLDGLPELASFAYIPTVHDGDIVNGYVNIGVARKVRAAPAGSKLPPGRNVAIYRLTNYMPQNEGGIEGVSGYFCVKSNGSIRGCLATGDKNQSTRGCAVLSYFADRRVLWNVTAKEHEAHATFGVHEEQIKSLFYARDLPLSGTGRKRPILHWVAAHQRRMKSGTEVDIEKHLRGISGFEMNGTRFEITRPFKPTSAKPPRS